MTVVGNENALKQSVRLNLPLKKIIHIGANAGQEVEPVIRPRPKTTCRG